MSKTVVFYDSVCPAPYDEASLEAGGLGGTEATVVRVATALDTRAVETYVVQHNRQGYSGAATAQTTTYLGLAEARYVERPDWVVVLRDVNALAQAKLLYPFARLALWLHDLPTHHLGDTGNNLALADAVIGVSKFHAQVIADALKGHPGLRVPVRHIYNPVVVPPHLSSPLGNYNPNKLIFFSSPHKGLQDALDLFRRLRVDLPGLELQIANPGYLPTPQIDQTGVTVLGALPHHKVLQHVASSLATFFPNRVFPETFGLVLAESNAVGTPVLTHPIGAAREVLYHPAETIDTTRPDNVLARIRDWSTGARPHVKARPEFALAEVTRQWQNLLA